MACRSVRGGPDLDAALEVVAFIVIGLGKDIESRFFQNLHR